MTDIKEPINATSDGTILSVVCENTEKSVVGQKLGGLSPPPPPQELPSCIYTTRKVFLEHIAVELVYKSNEKSYCECVKR